MDVTIHLTDQQCIQWVTRLQQLYPDQDEFSKHIEMMLKVFQHFVDNAKWEFTDDSSKQLQEHFQDQIRNTIHENGTEIKHSIELQLNEQMTQLEERISRPMESEFQKFQDSIDQFRGLSKNASSKGKIGEMNIERQLEWYFPESSIEDTRSDAQQADYHFTLEEFTILLEIKTYSKNVPSKEIDKFLRDLTTKSHIPAGILISATSGIVRKPKFSYEIISSDNGPKVAVYIPQAIDETTGNCISVVWGILFVLRVLQFQKQHKPSAGSSEGSLEDACEMIRHQLTWLEYLVDQNQEMLGQLEKCYRKSSSALEDWLSQCKKSWKMVDDILKQQIQVTKKYINEGKKEFIPMPTGELELESSTTWKCCGKVYKTQRNYDKHQEQKHALDSKQSKLI